MTIVNVKRNVVSILLFTLDLRSLLASIGLLGLLGLLGLTSGLLGLAALPGTARYSPLIVSISSLYTRRAVG
jgi:hypothetical protein